MIRGTGRGGYGTTTGFVLVLGHKLRVAGGSYGINFGGDYYFLQRGHQYRFLYDRARGRATELVDT